MPFANGCVDAIDHRPREAFAVSACTGSPEGLDPANTLTMTVDESPDAVPAVPENVGLWFVVVRLTGRVNDTAGAVVSTLHDA